MLTYTPVDDFVCDEPPDLGCCPIMGPLAADVPSDKDLESVNDGLLIALSVLVIGGTIAVAVAAGRQQQREA